MNKRRRRDVDQLQVLGEAGSTATVYAVVFQGTNAAIKVMWIDKDSHNDEKSIRHEANIHKQVDEHPNVVSLFAICVEEDRGILVMERCDRTLGSWIKAATRCPSRREIVYMMRDLLLALEFCHRRRIVHRDVKPYNILMDADGHLKLADFGLASQFVSDAEAAQGRNVTAAYATIWWRAPELFLHDEQARVRLTYSYPVDMWAAGCVFAEICTRRPLFRADTNTDLFLLVLGALGAPSKTHWPDGYLAAYILYCRLLVFGRIPHQFRFLAHIVGDEGLDLVRSLVAWAPHERITATQALAHPFLSTKDHD